MEEAKSAIHASCAMLPPCTMNTGSGLSLALMLIQKIAEESMVLEERVRLLEEEIKTMKSQR